MSDRLDITNLDNSPRGTRFMLPDPGPEADGREYWDTDLCHKYEHYIERSNNRLVLFGKKRADYRRWLSNQSGPLEGNTRKERQFDANTRIQAIRHFELQDNQVYRKAETIKGHRFPARYAACTWDSYDIICRIHRALKHFGKSLESHVSHPLLISLVNFV
jgi:hypothetical protein